MRAFRRTKYDREILTLALPALGALAADPLVSLVDTAFIGRLGTEPLASLGVAVAVFGIAFALANFLPYGATPLIADASARGDTESAGRLGRGTLAVAVGTGLVAMVVLEVAAPGVARVMGASSELLDGTVGYLRIRALALPAVLVILGANGIFRGHQDTRSPLLVSLGITMVNLVLDPILIFTFDMGLQGAAWASVVAQWMGGLAFLGLLIGSRSPRLAMRAGSGLAYRELFSAGSALIVRTGALIGSFSLATAVAARIGTVAVAAHQIAFQIWLFLALVIDALAIAAQARVGAYLGSGAEGEAREVSNRLLAMGVMLGTGLLVVLGAGASVVPGWFSADAAVIAAVGTVYPFVVLTQPLNAIVFVWDGIGIGAASFRFLAVGMVGAAVISAVGLALVIPLDLGLVGVWSAVLILMLARALTLAWWYERGPLARRRGPASQAA